MQKPSNNGFYVLITGANSGLGLGIGSRLIDEFLATRSQQDELILIITTRDKRKGEATVEHLKNHLHKACQNIEKEVQGTGRAHEQRVHFRPEILDLTSLLSVQKLSKKLRDEIPKLDVVICNAGIGGWDNLYWGRAVWTILTGLRSAVTYPTFKKSGVGWLTKPQIPKSEGEKKIEEPPLGEVFCANIFGHYLLGHYLAPLMTRGRREDSTRGRIIWVSSLEAYAHTFDLEDMQGILSTAPYESTKRQTDLMGISSTLPSTAPLVNQYFSAGSDPSKRDEKKITRSNSDVKPRIYVSHPGICGTAIFPLNFFLDFCMLVVFYMARWMGSQWHPITAYKGAVAMVWLALAKQSTLDEMEAREGVGKWGSATDWWGAERVERTEVEGWGWGGRIGEWSKRKGRSPYAKTLTEDSKKEFEESGRKTWGEMERLRIEWERILDEAGVGIKME